MALFQHSIVQKYLNTQANIETAWQVFQQNFQIKEKQENIRQSKEEQYQEGFLNDLFVSVLGYTLNPNVGYNLITEQKNKKNSKKADGAIIFNENGIEKIVAVIELKGMDTTDLNKIEQQAFNYKNSHNCAYVITSNFQKLRFYIQSNEEYLEFDLFKLKFEDFRLMYLCLALDNIRLDIPLKLKNESLIEEEKITLKLYKEYSNFKTELYHDLVQNNPNHDPVLLFQKTQKLLDRFLFILFAEDKYLLEPNFLYKLIEEWENLKKMRVMISLYDHVKQYFHFLDVGLKDEKGEIFAYNGGLFKHDERLNTLIISDDVLKQHLLSLIKYDFNSEVDVNILGHIFENSINELDELKAELNGEQIAKSQTKRKKDGVFYTPKYITHYIVKQTVGVLCENKKQELDILDEYYYSDKKQQAKTKQKHLAKLQQYREWLLQLTICDPACGSGAFLNEALNFLIAEHAYIDELESKLFGGGLVFQEVRNHILENNLFGVDINQESVEIAKLSLWLRTAEPHRKLSNLNHNLQCGNSLIDDPSVAGDKAFNWQQAFPHVFEKGGFDVVIGNPPYVNAKGENFTQIHKDFYYKNYKTAVYQIDTYILFIEKLKHLLRKDGLASYIVPNAWLNNLLLSDVRKFVLESFQLIEIVNTPSGVFNDAVVDTIIFNIVNNNIRDKEVKILKAIGNQIEFFQEVNQSFYLENTDFIIDIFSSNAIRNILNKIEFNTSPLSNFSKIGRGVGVYHKRVGHTKSFIEEDPYQSTKKEDETFVPYLRGKNIGYYHYYWNNDSFISYGNWLAEPREIDFFEGDRIILRQIPSKNKLLITFVDKDYIIDQSVFIARFLEKNKSYSKPILAILGSKMMFFYFRNKYAEFDDLFPKVKLQHFKDFPINSSDDNLMKELEISADKMLELNQELHTLVSKFNRLLERKFEIELNKALLNWQTLSFKDFIKELGKKKIKLSLADEVEWEEFFLAEQKKAIHLTQQIEQTDRTINQLVYELYGLTEEEIALIEQETSS